MEDLDFYIESLKSSGQQLRILPVDNEDELEDLKKDAEKFNSKYNKEV